MINALIPASSGEVSQERAICPTFPQKRPEIQPSNADPTPTATKRRRLHQRLNEVVETGNPKRVLPQNLSVRSRLIEPAPRAFHKLILRDH